MASKYLDLLRQSDEQKQEQEIQFQVEEAQQQLDADILATKRSLAVKKKELVQTMGSFPLDSQLIINLQLETEGLENGLQRLETLKKELF